MKVSKFDACKVFGPCPECAQEILLVAGAKMARCENCGYKDSCCY